MKDLIFVLLITGIALNLQSQEVTKAGHEIFTSTSYLHLKSTFRHESEIGYFYRRSVHAVGVSALITLLTNDAESSPRTPKVSGVSLCYINHVPSSIKFLEFELMAGTAYRVYSNTWAFNSYSSQRRYISVNTSSLEHMFSLSAGYGIRICLGKHLFIAQSIQGGIFKSVLNSGRNQHQKAVNIASAQHDFRRYGNVGWLLRGNIGIGWLF